MIFLPNKFERLVSALRNTIQRFILKNGITFRYLYILMLIFKAEAINSSEIYPMDLTDFSRKILSSVFIKKTEQDKLFNFSVDDVGGCVINPKLYLSLLLLLSRESDGIFIKLIGNKILIKSNKKTSLFINNEIKKISGVYLKEIKTDSVCIVFTPHRTDKDIMEIKKDWYDLTNPLSVINCYLS